MMVASRVSASCEIHFQFICLWFAVVWWWITFTDPQETLNIDYFWHKFTRSSPNVESFFRQTIFTWPYIYFTQNPKLNLMHNLISWHTTEKIKLMGKGMRNCSRTIASWYQCTSITNAFHCFDIPRLAKYPENNE